MIFQEIFSHRINTFLIDIEAGVFVFFVLVNLYLLELGSWVIIEQRVLDFHLISLKIFIIITVLLHLQEVSLLTI